ncbi:MAG: YbaY family lipoprotein [Aeromicrobium sp.]|uniref:YbaY family lipoprotein n=1 Tax=Aeromicrobium sp. TaxID=1871063 RepID=UPI003C54D07F
MTSEPLLIIEGTLTVREGDAVSDGAIASIKLVDAAGEVLSATAVRAHELPVSFTLHADPAFLTADGELLLWAALRTEVGLWGTADLVPVADDTPELVLPKIDG